MFSLRFLPLLVLALASNTYADVPNVFTPGTTAKASEVNENFRILDDGLEMLDGRVSNLESVSNPAGCGSKDLLSPYYPLSYSAKSSNLGDRIVVQDREDPNVGDRVYRIVEFPIVEFRSGDLYKIRMPARVHSNPDTGTEILSHNVEMYNAQGGLECSNLEVDGYPAYSAGISERRYIQLDYKETSDEHDGVNIGISYELILQIKIEKTVLQFEAYAGDLEDFGVPVSPGDYDFTDNIDTSKMKHREDLKKALDDLIDYIQIEKVN